MRIIKWPKWYIIISLFLGIVFFIYHFEPTSKIINDVFKQDLKLSFEGLVIDKYIDHKNHNSKTCVILEDGDTTIILLNFDESGLYNYLFVGDSVFKNNGDSLILVKRRNDIRHFYLNY